ncbi:hypothetical protein [Pedobacter sp. NJ-S-72]
MGAVTIYGRFGNTESRRGKEEETQSHKNLEPKDKAAKAYLLTWGLTKMTDNNLLNLAFEPLNNSDYGPKIKNYFMTRLGQVNEMKMERWVSEFTNKNALFESIARDIKANHTMFHDSRGGRIDVSKSIELNMPNFRVSPTNLSEMIAIGGVQGREIKNNVIRENFEQSSLDRYGKGTNKPHTANISLEVLIKDWYGVDESDFTNFRPAALFARKPLAALWVLQHQRGYKPFINLFKYEHNLKVIF